MAENPTARSAAHPSPKSEAPNKAQAEFDKYKQRAQAQQVGVAGAPFPESGLSWAVPPSVAMMPRYVNGPGMMPPGSLVDSIGTSLRLGIDVINAALAGGVRMLGGFADAYRHEGCGCEKCREPSCCEESCCEPDCCGCECCHPGVGSCC
jgi:hypothetical protein